MLVTARLSSIEMLTLCDLTDNGVEWLGYMLSVDVTGLDSMKLQWGFKSLTKDWESVGMFYDNVKLLK